MINYYELPGAQDGKPFPLDPITIRKLAYDIPEQLNLLYDDIEAGVFGEEAKTGKFAQYIKAIKQQYPK